MRIRKFLASDAEEVSELHKNTILKVCSKDYTEEQISKWVGRSCPKMFTDSMKKVVRFVAVEGDKIIGFGDFFPKGELGGLYVHYKHLRKGVGSRLLKTMEKTASGMGIRGFYLFSTLSSKNFYESRGYSVVEKTIYDKKDRKLPVFKMAKQF